MTPASSYGFQQWTNMLLIKYKCWPFFKSPFEFKHGGQIWDFVPQGQEHEVTLSWDTAPCWRSGLSICDLWWTKWQWDRFFSQLFGFLLSVSSNRDYLCSEMNFGPNSRPVSGCSSKIYSHPIDMNNKNNSIGRIILLYEILPRKQARLVSYTLETLSFEADARLNDI
jgi:hypothetical protein